MLEAKPFWQFFYSFSVLQFNIQPSEVWNMTPEDFWVIYREFAQQKGLESKEDSKTQELLAILELPEANTVKVHRGDST